MKKEYVYLCLFILILSFLIVISVIIAFSVSTNKYIRINITNNTSQSIIPICLGTQNQSKNIIRGNAISQGQSTPVNVSFGFSGIFYFIPANVNNYYINLLNPPVTQLYISFHGNSSTNNISLDGKSLDFSYPATNSNNTYCYASMQYGYNYKISIEGQYDPWSTYSIINNCPSQLLVNDGNEIFSCANPCVIFGSNNYCCTGQYSCTSGNCNPTSWSPQSFSNTFISGCSSCAITNCVLPQNKSTIDNLTIYTINVSN